jgi:hypothetical protein
MAVSNLDEAGRRKRRRAGFLSAVAAVLLSVATVWLMGGWWVVRDGPAVNLMVLSRLVVFPFYYLAASGFLQARAGTCVARAPRGEREEAGCGIKLDDADRAAELRAAARRIQRQSLAFALAATAVVFFLPVGSDSGL